MKIHYPKSDKEWHALRGKVITATQCPSILGLNPYQSAAAMWREKQENTFFGNSFTDVGKLLEPIVVEMTNKVLHTSFELYEGKTFYELEDIHLGATPDAHSNGVLLECKTTRPHTFLKYSELPPLNYLMQLQVQSYCTQTQKGYLAISSTDFTQHTLTTKWPLVVFEVERCDRLYDITCIELKRFWATVKAGKMFRTNSKFKKLAKLLLFKCFKKVR